MKLKWVHIIYIRSPSAALSQQNRNSACACNMQYAARPDADASQPVNELSELIENNENCCYCIRIILKSLDRFCVCTPPPQRGTAELHSSYLQWNHSRQSFKSFYFLITVKKTLWSSDFWLLTSFNFQLFCNFLGIIEDQTTLTKCAGTRQK